MKQLEVNLNAEDKDIMEKLLAAGQLKHKYAVRLQTVLLRAKGKGSPDISDFLGIHPCTVSLHINRYNNFGIDSLLRDKTRKPGTKPITQEVKNKIYQLACNKVPQKRNPLELSFISRACGHISYSGKYNIKGTWFTTAQVCRKKLQR